jgi:hypothetical protein
MTATTLFIGSAACLCICARAASLDRASLSIIALSFSWTMFVAGAMFAGVAHFVAIVVAVLAAARELGGGAR